MGKWERSIAAPVEKNPLLCSKLADNASDFWLALPLVQALLPALRPSINSSDPIDEDLSLWKQPFVQKALSQIVGTSSSSVYRPLLSACAGYLSSFSPSNGRAACVLIDLCSGVLAPWMPQVIAKIDLALELLEDLLPVIQGTHHSYARARAALKYIVLALSEVMDDILVKYKDAKHQVLFLVEMLEPYLDPAITPAQSIIAFGNVSSVVLENQEKNCAIALNVIHTAVLKPAVLPSLEAEWRHGSVVPNELAVVGHLEQKDDKKIEESGSNSSSRKGGESRSPQNGDQSFSVIYPDINQFFPNLQKEFEVFGESILEAVALQLRSFSSAIVPDLLCWFSDFCSWPFFREENQPFCRRSTGFAKGFVAKNAKAIVFYVLEAIVAEHMEALVPEVPTLVLYLLFLNASLCIVDQWISQLCGRSIHTYHECEGSLIDLFSFMLCHPEPEQRFIALKHLGRLMSQDGHSGSALLCSSICDKVASSVSKSFACEPIISALVSGTWDQVALLVSSDPSQRLRIHAMALLVNYVPFSERRNLQSFLAAADTVLQCLTKLSQPTCEGPLAQLSIILFAKRFPVSLEKRTCQALCRLRNEGDEAKEIKAGIQKFTPYPPSFHTCMSGINKG
ncbi:hypothetical protein KY284_004159 [Solanum tuberosum]|nr:hypothetical protein KY284_004159 [Solanum tuberosum]